MALREYAGAAKRTALSGDITAASTTITVADATGYPTGATGPFAIALSQGQAAEEKLLVTSRSGNTLTISTRGYDGTSASAHSSGSTVDHVLTAIDIREANEHVNGTTDVHGIPDTADLLTASDADALFLTPAEASAAYVARAEVVTARIETSETTTSTSFVDLATVGPTATVTIGASGRALVMVSAYLYGSTASSAAIMSFSVGGGAALDIYGLQTTGVDQMQIGNCYLISGVTPGAAVTFRAKYRVTAGTGTFLRRQIVVLPL